jgi:hypothetical protein
MAKEKIIYTFNVHTTKEVEVEEEKVVDGETVKITKVEEQEIPHLVVLKRPTRRQVEEARIEAAVKKSELIKRGVMTKPMLLNSYSNAEKARTDDSPHISEEDHKYLMKLHETYGMKLLDIQELETKSKKSAYDKKKIKALREETVELKREIVNREMIYQNLFEDTADVLAQNHQLLWYMTQLCYIRHVNEEDEPEELIYSGETFDEQLDKYYELEDGDDELYEQAKRKIPAALSFWFFSQVEPEAKDIEIFLDSDFD